MQHTKPKEMKPRSHRGQFTCSKGHLSETNRQIRARVWVRVRARFSVKFRNLHNYISDKWPFGQVTCNRSHLVPYTSITERIKCRQVEKTSRTLYISQRYKKNRAAQIQYRVSEVRETAKRCVFSSDVNPWPWPWP